MEWIRQENGKMKPTVQDTTTNPRGMCLMFYGNDLDALQGGLCPHRVAKARRIIQGAIDEGKAAFAFYRLVPVESRLDEEGPERLKNLKENGRPRG